MSRKKYITVNEPRISFNTAKKLKETDFRLNVGLWYSSEEDQLENYFGIQGRLLTINTPNYLAPSLMLLLRWFQEKHGIRINQIYDDNQSMWKFEAFNKHGDRIVTSQMFQDYELGLEDILLDCIESIINK